MSNLEEKTISIFDVPEDGKIVLKDNRRGRLFDKAEKGYLVHIILNDGSHLITDPGVIEAYISKDGWVEIKV